MIECVTFHSFNSMLLLNSQETDSKTGHPPIRVVRFLHTLRSIEFLEALVKGNILSTFQGHMSASSHPKYHLPIKKTTLLLKIVVVQGLNWFKLNRSYKSIQSNAHCMILFLFFFFLVLISPDKTHSTLTKACKHCDAQCDYFFPFVKLYVVIASAMVSTPPHCCLK